MREVEQVDVEYGEKGWVSVFVGICQSREQLEDYLEKDHERLGVDDIGCEMGIDFGINSYDEDVALIAFKQNATKQIAELFDDAAIFELSELEKRYPDGLDRAYNAICELGELKYTGDVTEFDNTQFGFFKFLGAFSARY